MALLNSLLLLLVVTTAVEASPREGDSDKPTSGQLAGHRHLLAAMPGAPSIANIGTVGPAAVLYVDVKPPAGNGGSPIAAYEVTGTPDGGPAPGKPTLQTTGMGTPTTGVNNLRFTFSSYPRGVPYRFTVRAGNLAGWGPASTPPTAFTTPKQGVPGPPVLVAVTRLHNGVYLDVTPPAHARPLTYTLVGHPDGGATAKRPRIVITGKGSLVPGAVSSSPSQLLGRPGGSHPDQAKRRFRVTGYLPNTVYRFAASAANSAGAGPESVPRTLFYECSSGYRDTGAGCQCAPLAHCKTYSDQDCKCTQCNPGWDSCDGTITNGCKTDLGSSPQHCGSCTTACDAGQLCTNGSCTSNAIAWGLNDAGALGDGTRKTVRRTPVSVHGGIVFTQITAGFDHTCGIDAAGHAHCWGLNYNGQLGDGTTGDKLTPVSVQGGIVFTQISAGSLHTCGIDAAGAASCWGYNAVGQLGDGSAGNNRLTPVSVHGGIVFTQISAGDHYTCGIDEATRAWCWGFNDFGQLGDGTTGDKSTPARLFGSTAFKQISAGRSHTCGIDTAGRARCWGRNDGGQLGDGTTGDTLTPVSVLGGTMFTRISAGGSHTCGIDTAKHASCWGHNVFGQLGDGTTGNKLSPVSVQGSKAFRNIAAGAFHTCGVDAANYAWCWGYNTWGQLGNNDSTFRSMNTPAAVVGDTVFTRISTGYSHTAALASA